MSVLDHVAVRLLCPACGKSYDVPLRDVMLSHEVVRSGCPVCHETECPPVFQVRLFDRAAIRELEEAWTKVAERAQRDGGELVFVTEMRDSAEPALDTSA